MSLVTLTSCRAPVKNHLKYALHPLPSVTLAGLMISELSAGCECRLFGTGLVVSENASDCTHAAYRDRKIKKISGKGAQPPPPNLTLSILGAYGPSILALDLLPLHFHHLPPPYTHTSGYGPASCVCRRHPDLRSAPSQSGRTISRWLHNFAIAKLTTDNLQMDRILKTRATLHKSTNYFNQYNALNIRILQ